MIHTLFMIWLWGLLPTGVLAGYRIFFTPCYENDIIWVLGAWVLWPATLVIITIELIIKAVREL